jgi:hypothetical protein
MPTDPALRTAIGAVEHGDEALGHAIELVQPVGQHPVERILLRLAQRRTERQQHLERLQPGRIEAGQARASR